MVLQFSHGECNDQLSNKRGAISRSYLLSFEALRRCRVKLSTATHGVIACALAGMATPLTMSGHEYLGYASAFAAFLYLWLVVWFREEMLQAAKSVFEDTNHIRSNMDPRQIAMWNNEAWVGFIDEINQRATFISKHDEKLELKAHGPHLAFPDPHHEALFQVWRNYGDLKTGGAE